MRGMLLTVPVMLTGVGGDVVVGVGVVVVVVVCWTMDAGGAWNVACGLSGDGLSGEEEEATEWNAAFWLNGPAISVECATRVYNHVNAPVIIRRENLPASLRLVPLASWPPPPPWPLPPALAGRPVMLLHELPSSEDPGKRNFVSVLLLLELRSRCCFFCSLRYK